MYVTFYKLTTAYNIKNNKRHHYYYHFYYYFYWLIIFSLFVFGSLSDKQVTR